MDEKKLAVEATSNNPVSVSNPTPIQAEGQSVASSRDLDDAYDLYRRQDAVGLDPHEARQVLRKIDWHILPLLMGTYLLQYLDKSSVNFASVFGLRQGTNLHGQDYSWSLSIFYFGMSCRGKQSLRRLISFVYVQDTWWRNGQLAISCKGSQLGSSSVAAF